MGADSNLCMNKLALIDTSILAAATRDKAVGRGLFQLIATEKLFCGIGVETLLELRADPNTFSTIASWLQIMPFFICTPHKEVIAYENRRDQCEAFKPILISLFGKPFEEIQSFVSDCASIVDEEFPLEKKAPLLLHLTGMVKNYPPSNTKSGYSRQEIESFIAIITKAVLNGHNDAPYFRNHNLVYDPSVFRSIESKAAIVFWKFYKMRDRNPRESDILDIQMSYLFPYFDYVLTEGNIASDIRQMQKKLGIMSGVQRVLTQKDLRRYTDS